MNLLKIFKKRKLNSGFFLAVSRGSISRVSEFIDKGADVNSRDNFFTLKTENMDHVFYGKGIRISPYENFSARKAGRTAVALAVMREYPELLELLCQKGANVNLGTRKGYKEIIGEGEHPRGITPLMDVVNLKSNQIEIANILLKYGAKIDLKNSAGETAFFLAATEWWRANFDLVKLLIESGADVNIRNKEGESVIEYLYDYINTNDSNSTTSLDSYKNSLRIAEYLLNTGITTEDKNISKSKFLTLIKKRNR